MTQRTPTGYTHIHAYRTWLPEHNELLRIVALKGRDTTALNNTMSLEALSVCLGRSPTAIAKQAAKLEVVILDKQQLDMEHAIIEKDAAEFAGKIS